MIRQCTVKEKISCVGTGLHTGKPIKLEILPAPEDNGITFERTDIPNARPLKASFDNVSHTELATTIGSGTESISTIEHLMAAMFSLGINNARILVGGPEVPIMDGSASPFVFMLQKAGSEEQNAQKRFAIINKSVTVRDGDKYATISPSQELVIRYGINFPNPLIGTQNIEIKFSTKSFIRELARARTFGFLKDVEYLKSHGLGQKTGTGKGKSKKTSAGSPFMRFFCKRRDFQQLSGMARNDAGKRLCKYPSSAHFNKELLEHHSAKFCMAGNAVQRLYGRNLWKFSSIVHMFYKLRNTVLFEPQCP